MTGLRQVVPIVECPDPVFWSWSAFSESDHQARKSGDRRRADARAKHPGKRSKSGHCVADMSGPVHHPGQHGSGNGSVHKRPGHSRLMLLTGNASTGRAPLATPIGTIEVPSLWLPQSHPGQPPVAIGFWARMTQYDESASPGTRAKIGLRTSSGQQRSKNRRNNKKPLAAAAGVFVWSARPWAR